MTRKPFFNLNSLKARSNDCVARWLAGSEAAAANDIDAAPASKAQTSQAARKALVLAPFARGFSLIPKFIDVSKCQQNPCGALAFDIIATSVTNLYPPSRHFRLTWPREANYKCIVNGALKNSDPVGLSQQPGNI
jgi:hypothetical protein